MRPGFKFFLKNFLFLLLIQPPLYWILLFLDLIGAGPTNVGTKELFFSGKWAPSPALLVLPIYWIALIACYVVFVKDYNNGILTRWSYFKLVILYPNIVYILLAPLLFWIALN